MSIAVKSNRFGILGLRLRDWTKVAGFKQVGWIRSRDGTMQAWIDGKVEKHVEQPHAEYRRLPDDEWEQRWSKDLKILLCSSTETS